MREIELYARGMRIADSDGNLIPIGARPVVQWREKVGFTVALPSGSFGAGSYKYAFDYDRDFLHSEPCNSGECAVSNGVLTFEVTFNSVRQAEATNGRVKPIPFYIQITKDGEDNSAEYILDDSIWAAGCVWDGRIPPAPEAPNYYTKAEVDEIAEDKLDKPEEAGEEGYVLGLAEDGSTVWIPQSGGGGGVWGSITGDLSSQADLADALDGKANLVNGLVPESELPRMTGLISGVSKARPEYGTKTIFGNEYIATEKASNENIDLKTHQYKPIVPSNLDYAVRSVLPNVTTIPSATTAYSLLDASATTNNHSWQYFHAPSSASTYVFPAVTDDSVAHRIKLTIDFTTMQTYSFEDAQGDPILPLFTPSITAGDVYAFRCEWSSVQSKWLIYPHKQGAVSDDYVMQSQVGAANGVAGLDSSGLVPSAELPLAVNKGDAGVVRVDEAYGAKMENQRLSIICASNNQITNRYLYNYNHNPIVPSNLNYAVTAALSDANKIQLTAAQKLSAQDTLGVGAAPIIGTTAPTTSTVGSVGQLYVDTTTSKTYHCTAVTESNGVTIYTWGVDIHGGVNNGSHGLGVGTNVQLSGNNSIALGSNALATGGSNRTAIGPYSRSDANGSVAIGDGAEAHYEGSVAIGTKVKTSRNYQTAAGCSIIATDDESLSIGIGSLNTTSFDFPGFGVTSYGGMRHLVTAVPSATTSYMLAEGCFTHVPSAASTYTLPAITPRVMAGAVMWRRNPSKDGTGYYGWLSGTTNCYTASAAPAVGDNTYTNTALTSGAKAITAIDNRTHEIILTVRFSSSVQTYAFEDSSGNAITPLPLAGTIADGSVVAFRCTWEALLNGWVIMPVMLGTYQEVEP